MSTIWRPHPGIRAIAIAVVWRGPELLVVGCDRLFPVGLIEVL